MTFTSKISAQSGRPGVRNQRTTVRYHCAPATSGKVFLPDDQEFQRAWVQNLSRNGVGLLVGRAVPTHTVLTLRMQRADQGEPVDLAAQVVHVEERYGGDVYVGCELMRPLTLEELDALLA